MDDVDVLTGQHASVGSVGYGEQMRRNLVSTLAQVQLDHGRRVDRESLVRIDHDAKEAGIGLDFLRNQVEVERGSKRVLRR
jgi:hypothetical protein